MKNYTKKIFIFSLAAVLFLNNTGCFKRVAVSLDSPKVDSDDIVHVTLKSGVVYKLTRAKFAGEYLMGMNQSKEIRIALQDIQSIEVVRFDQKKIMKGMIITSLILFTLFAIGHGLALAGLQEENPPLE